MTALHVVLPWPPTTNKYWRHPTTGKLAGRHLLSAEGRAYRDAIANTALVERWPTFGQSRIALEIEAWMPDRRRRDLDNLLKGICDSLTHAGLWKDDEQIDDLRITRAPALGGMLKVRVSTREDVCRSGS